MRMIEKASGRQVGSAASGISGEVDPSPARFLNPPLTEGLEQASEDLGTE